MSSSRWQPTATVATLQLRAQMLAAIRRFFDSRGFIEVQTPVLSHDTVVDRYINPIGVSLTLQGDEHSLWLQTSPEFCMKRLIAAGAQAIYQIGPAFRGGESGAGHNPEFTMLEWYRVGDDYQQGQVLLGEFAEDILQAQPAEPISFREVFRQFAEIDPFDASVEELGQCLNAVENTVPAADRNGLLNQILATIVEPHLGQSAPHIVFDWPADQAALAQVRPGNPPLAERFELYVAGVELANGYHELTNAYELNQRMQSANRQRIAVGHPPLPTDSRLVAAMRAGLPECCGVALGIDRLVMIATGAQSIRDVIAFPFDIA